MEDEQATQATEMENKIAASILTDLKRADEAEEILAARSVYERTGEVPIGAPEGITDLTDVQLKGYRDSRISLHQRRLMWEAAGRTRRRALGEPETIEEQRQKLSGSVRLRKELALDLGTDPGFVEAVQDALAERDAEIYGDGAGADGGPEAREAGKPDDDRRDES